MDTPLSHRERLLKKTLQRFNYQYESIDPKSLLALLPYVEHSQLLLVKFLQACCVINPSCSELNKRLYTHYYDWCEHYKHKPLGKTLFGKNLVKFGLETLSLGKGYYQFGVCLKDEKPIYPDKLDLSGLIEYTQKIKQKRHEQQRQAEQKLREQNQ